PAQLYHLNTAIEGYLNDVERPVVYADDLDMIEAVHGREDLRAWIRHMSGKCAEKGGTLVLRSSDATLASGVGCEWHLSSQSSPAGRAFNALRRLLAHVSRVLPRGLQTAA